jgi:hypothetical protein
MSEPKDERLETDKPLVDPEKSLLQRELKRNKVRQKLMELFLRHGGLGRAVGTALSELEGSGAFDVDESGALVLRQEDVNGASAAKDVETWIEQFLDKRDYLRDRSGAQSADMKNHFNKHLRRQGGMRNGRLELARRFIGEEFAPDHYSERQESADTYLRRRTSQLRQAVSGEGKSTGPQVSLASRNGRLMAAAGMTADSRSR